MTDDSSPKTAGSAEVKPVAVIDVAEAPATKWFLLRRDSFALVRYLLDSEVHTYAFSVAANAILSFIPFAVLLYTMALSVFHSYAMVKVVNDMVRYYFPSTASQDFLTYNLSVLAPRHGVQVFSLVVILIACTGIFLPLEVALNQAWGVAKSRNYLMNQTVAFCLALLMVALAMISVFVNESAQQILTFVFFHHTENMVYRGLSYLWMSISTGAAAIVFFFFIYWILPNRKVPWKPVLRAAVVTGIVWLGARSIFVMVLPHLQLKVTYGPFFVSVGLLLWAYISGLILFAGAQFSVARMGSGRVVSESR
ncbi:MAG TPA: YihY/virulence factor BrkB family protein [Terracidiphilus sp.]|nr:YihY/virulence factor BrkB family protein [Terracidiphilus sp.]